MAPVYRALPPQTRPFLKHTMYVATTRALVEIPAGRTRTLRCERQWARLHALYGVVQLLAAIDFSDLRTNAAVHLAVVRALAPVYLDPSFPDGAIRDWPVV